MANAGVLSVVLVSSEGSILSIVQALSGVSRCSKIFEVTDIRDETAREFLEKKGLSREMSKKFVDYTGGRFIYLVNVTTLHKMYKTVYSEIDDESLHQAVMKDLFSRKIATQRFVVDMLGEPSQSVFSAISKTGEYVPVNLLRDSDLENKRKLAQARYTSTVSLSWHGRAQQRELQQ